MPKFSIIIPVFNSGSFLSDCLDSCINQTFKDIEILCVYDYSTDNSLEILNTYAKKDNRIKLIVQQHNHHLGGARNTGVQHAAGEYSWFIDSDDSVLLNSCEILSEIIKKVNSDIIRFNAISYEYNIQTGEKTINDSREYVCTWPFDTLFLKNKKYTFLQHASVPVWLYVARTSLLKGVKYREDTIEEDVDFTPILFSKSNSIYCVNFPFYYKRNNKNSLIGTGKREPHIIADIYAAQSLANFITAEKIEKHHFCYKNLLSTLDGLKKAYNRYPSIHNHELDKIITELLKNGNNIRSLIFTFKRKLKKKIKRVNIFLV
jgi:glycosyltransferase involved in cell wall biosynthesis